MAQIREKESLQTPQLRVQQDNNINTTENNQGFLTKLKDISSQRFRRLRKTIIADFSYEPKNTFNAVYKQKIFSYLKAKYLTTFTELQEEKQKQKKFTSYNADFGKDIQFKNLKQMKQVLLKLNTNIQAAQDSLKQSESSLKNVQGNYYNQIAFEFDKQRRSSTAWGLLFGSIICATVYRKGNIIRKSALFWTSGLLFFQLSFRYNIDKYFDSVYPIFEQDAVKYVEHEQKQLIQKQSRKVKGENIMQQ